jgi:hypothetical protein
MHVVGDWIIFSCDGGLYRMRTDGSGLAPIVEVEYLINSVNIYDDWIFYRYNIMTQDGTFIHIYKVRIDGTGQTLVDVITNLAGFIVEDGWIYFSDYIDAENKGLYKMRIDGSELQRIGDDCAIFMNAFNGWIYYIYLLEDSDSGHGLYRIRTDGTEREMIHEVEFRSLLYSLNITDEWLYFTERRRHAEIGKNTPSTVRFRHDGTEREIVYQTFTRE